VSGLSSFPLHLHLYIPIYIYPFDILCTPPGRIYSDLVGSPGIPRISPFIYIDRSISFNYPFISFKGRHTPLLGLTRIDSDPPDASRNTPGKNSRNRCQTDPLRNTKKVLNHAKCRFRWLLKSNHEKVRKIHRFGKASNLLNLARTHTRARFSHVQPHPKKS
jgi:hypothetical protein